MYFSSIRKPLLGAALCVLAVQANAAFDIQVTGVQDAYKSYFTAAENYWESVITGYQPGIVMSGLSISVQIQAIDGVGGVLGGGGPQSVRNRGGFILATLGSIELDSADVGSMITAGSFADVIKHEIAHVIGFGTLWELNGVYQTSGQYTGANALAAYRTEFNQPGAAYVPVEIGGSAGTADGHWDEVNVGAGNTGITANGKDMKNELMTGWLNTPTFVSRTTIASFQDIGYTVSAVPEPESLLLFAAGLPLVLRLGARRKAQLAAAARA